MSAEDRLSSYRIAAEFRQRAADARAEAELRGPQWWGHEMLLQGAAYFEQRALEMEQAGHSALANTDPGGSGDCL
jgi:hypothetical protein